MKDKQLKSSKDPLDTLFNSYVEEKIENQGGYKNYDETIKDFDKTK